MPKHVRRITVTRTVTFTATIDTAGRPEESDANIIIANGGAAGATGVLAIAELLAGSLANAGIVTRGAWTATGTSVNVEPYTVRPQNTALTLGQRIVSVSPPTGYEAARGKLFVVSVAGTTQNVATEPNWSLTDGNTTTDGTATLRTIPKFYTPTTAVTATTYAVGTILRPSATSLKEFLVTAQSGAFSTPTWSQAAGGNDTLGASFAAGSATLLCISGIKVYAVLTSYQLGDNVKPDNTSGEEYLVTQAGATDTSASSALTASVGSSVTIGGVIFKRII